ncbi:M50 family metallopeptidase [Paenarthrobacter ilicis]|uniref:daptide biosynthesis intramembrane metalloprotease n=1 Tax=Paenarthrobacter ilicis TaxID=43665 RepID=UPI003009EB4E
MRWIKEPQAAGPAVEWPVRLAPAASIDQPLQEGGPWIVAINGVPKARVSADVALFLKALDGRMDPAQVAIRLGPPWTAADVMGIVRRLAPTGMFDDGAKPASLRRVQFRAPLTVQITLFNPTKLLGSLRPAVAVLMRPMGAVAALLLLFGGLVGAVAAGPQMWKVLASPLPIEAYLYVVVAMFISTLLHELSHGMALTYFGGTPRRIGIMLFYLSPAFFCDVTDGWRLGSRKQRVLIAMAGPLAHVALGSIALATQMVLPESALKEAAVLYGMICYAVAVLNLFPFIKLDGYVALMSALDVPHLRQKSLDALGDVARGSILGARREHPGRGFLPWFGLACFVSGVIFMVVGFQRLLPIFLQLGFAGHAVVFLVLCLLLVMAGRGIYRFFRAGAANGSPLWRRSVVFLLGVAAAAALTAIIPVTPVTVAGYVYNHGELNIVVPMGSPGAGFTAGDHVTLQSQGMIIHENLGHATLGDQPPSDISAPLDTVVPVALDQPSIPAVAYAATLESGINLSSSGRAEIVSQHPTSLGQWLRDALTSSPLWPAGPVHPSDARKAQP